MTSHRILALDTGATCAWAYGHLIEQMPTEVGTLKLATSSVRDLLAARLDKLDQWLRDSMLHWGPTVVVLAERFRSRSMGEAATNLGLDALVRLHAYRCGALMLCQPEGTVRKEVLGRGGGISSDAMKALAMRWCADCNVAVQNHHEADACVLWTWANRELIHTASRAKESAKTQHAVGKKQRNKLAQKPDALRLKPEVTLV